MKRAIALLLALNALSLTPSLALCEGYPDTIFAMTDSYVAAEQDSSYLVGFVLMFNGEYAEPFAGREPVSITVGHDDIVSFSDRTLTVNDTMEDYTLATLNTTANFHAQGKLEIEELCINFATGESIWYPIGKFCFDVGEAGMNDSIYTYSTPAMSSNANEFLFTYQNENGVDAKLEQVYVETGSAMKLTLEDDLNGKIEFEPNDGVVYRQIRPRYTYSIDGAATTLYPYVGCYCGAMNIAEADMLAAYDYVVNGRQNPSSGTYSNIES